MAMVSDNHGFSTSINQLVPSLDIHCSAFAYIYVSRAFQGYLRVLDIFHYYYTISDNTTYFRDSWYQNEFSKYHMHWAICRE